MNIVNNLVKDWKTTKTRRSYYPAAAMNRLTTDFNGTILSANSAMFGDLKLMRSRGRTLERSNDYLRKFLLDCHKNINGSTGVGMQPRCYRDDGTTSDPDANRLVTNKWDRWSNKKFCNVNARDSWYETARLAVRTTMRDGECLLRKHYDQTSEFGLRLQLLEGDHLDSDYNVTDMPDGNMIIMGIEMTPLGKRVAYHLLTKHPGEFFSYGPPNRRERVLAKDVIYLGIPDRIGAARGFPWAISTMLRLNHLGVYEETELVGARAASAKMVAITRDLPQDWDGEDDGKGNVIEETEAGTAWLLPIGMKPQVLDWNHPNAIYPEFRKGTLQGISSGLGTSYPYLASDLQGVSFSSIRAGVLDERETWKFLQRFFEDELHQEVFEAWLEMSILGGALKALPGGMANFELYDQPIWHSRRWPWVDPKNDAEAHQISVKCGFESKSDVVQEMTGEGLEDLYEKIEADNKLAKDRNLVFPGLEPAVPIPRGSSAPPNGTILTNQTVDEAQPENDGPLENLEVPMPNRSKSTAPAPQEIHVHVHSDTAATKVIRIKRNERGQLSEVTSATEAAPDDNPVLNGHARIL